MLYQINNGTKYFGANDVFENVQFEVNEKEKIALIGRNGSGKSTLLKVMMNEEALSSGTIHANAKLRVGYLKQNTFENEQQSVQEAMDEAFLPIIKLQERLTSITEEMKFDHSEKKLEEYSRMHEQFELLGGYNYQNELEMILTKFGFVKDDLSRSISTFSGGQKTRLAFVRLLVSKPDILLLDEPTNHLDLKTIEWLEGYLKRYPNAIVLVSHDRTFINNIADTIYEMEFHQLKRYRGNYTSYENEKRANQLANQDAYKRQQKEIERLEKLIEKFRYKATKASFAQSKIKQLDKMDKIELDNTSDTKSFKARFEPRIPGGKNVLEIDNLKIGYDEVLCTVNLDLYKGNKVCVIGDNGTGKSTLLKTIVEDLKPLGGHYLFGHQIEIGYFDQNLIEFQSNKTVLEEIWDEYPLLDRTSIRTILGNFLFSADDVFKSVNVLSGGEKVRLAFVKLVLQKPNLLILDEPTNHLDIVGKQSLEEALKDYEGTVLMVSHDRYFVNKIATSCLLIENKKTTFFPYGYQEYVDRIKEDEVKTKTVKVSSQTNTVRTKIRNLEKQIDVLEIQLKELEAKRFLPEYYENFSKLQSLENEIDCVNEKLEQSINEWSILQEAA
ncbi:MAG: ABC-F family ATP-binding cassette domain-containing protein [Erysipelotrichaceae bacterium]